MPSKCAQNVQHSCSTIPTSVVVESFDGPIFYCCQQNEYQFQSFNFVLGGPGKLSFSENLLHADLKLA